MSRSQDTEVLTSKFESILGSDSVYYEPPENVHMQYPCIVYTREHIDVRKADNRSYSSRTQYKVTYICYDPDSDVIDGLIEAFPSIRHGNHFVTDGLHHDVFYIYV